MRCDARHDAFPDLLRKEIRTALGNSLGSLVVTDGAMTASFEEGYAQWQAANDGLFELPIAAVIDVISGLHPEG